MEAAEKQGSLKPSKIGTVFSLVCLDKVDVRDWLNAKQKKFSPQKTIQKPLH